MTKLARKLLGIGSLLLILGYLLPLWKINLDAPQYPEGLGLEIWVNTITGQKEHDLDNINSLNHYIGMKLIVPDSIPELKVMPYLLGFLLILGLVAVAVNRKWLLYTWVVLFMLLGIAGLVDFYKWAYDYGHDLNPRAAIKVPGMAYQPPIIGSKKLLNFTASSYPASGGLILLLSLGMGVVAIIHTERHKTKDAHKGKSP